MIRFFIVVIVLVLSQLSQAEEIDATPTTETARPIYGGQCQNGALTPGTGTHTSLGAAKTAAEGACAASGKWTMPEWPWTLVSAPTERWYKQYKYGTYLYEAKAERTHYACAGTNNSVSVNTPCTTYSCPASGGWNLVGNKCTRAECAPGDFRASDGTCKKDCSAKAGEAMPNARYLYDGTGDTFDVGGCQGRCAGRASISSGGETWTTGYNCSWTGRPSSGSDEPGEAGDPNKPSEPDDPTDCAAKGMGYIRSSTGKITCVPSVDAPPGNQPTVTEEKKGSTTGTPPASGAGTGTGGTSGTGGAPGTPGGPAGSVTESTTCKGPNCTTTTKTSTEPDTVTNGTANGGCPSGWTLVNGKCETTVVSEQPSSDYCTKNPNDKICKNQDSSFGGACEGGFTCDGDAATCAIARAAWETRCSYNADSTTSLFDGANAGGTAGDQSNAIAALNKDGAGDFNLFSAFTQNRQNYLAATDTCPNMIWQVPIPGGATFEIDGGIICDVGVFIRLLVHLVAYMALIRLFAYKLV